MTDLSEFVSDTPMRVSLCAKKAKVDERIEKMLQKLAPLQAESEMYDEMIAAIDKRQSAIFEAIRAKEAAVNGAPIVYRVGDTINAQPGDTMHIAASDTVTFKADEANTGDAAALPAFLRNNAG